MPRRWLSPMGNPGKPMCFELGGIYEPDAHAAHVEQLAVAEQSAVAAQ